MCLDIVWVLLCPLSILWLLVYAFVLNKDEPAMVPDTFHEVIHTKIVPSGITESKKEVCRHTCEIHNINRSTHILADSGPTHSQQVIGTLILGFMIILVIVR